MARVQQPAKEDSGTTRGRLIEAGLDIFGEHGFAAATTRTIADHAGVNLAAIPYHFGGKEGLYNAVIEFIVATIQQKLIPIVSAINEQLDTSALIPEEATALLEKLLSALIEFIVGSEEAPRFSRIILREQMTPSNSYASIYHGVMQPTLTVIAKLVGIITSSGFTEEVQIRAFALTGQIMAFRFARETLVRTLGLYGYSTEETQIIKKLLLEQTRATLFGLQQPTAPSSQPL